MNSRRATASKFRDSARSIFFNSFSCVSRSMTQSPLKLLHIYGDETCQTQHKFMALSCLVCPPDGARTLATTILNIKTELDQPGELKWEKVKARNIEKYKKVVDAYFDALESIDASFHAVVVDTSRLNYGLYASGDKDMGFNKFVFQILHKCSRLFAKDSRFLAYLDNRTTRQSLETLRIMLNHHARNKVRVYHSPFRAIEFLCSKRSQMLQINDILLGAVGYQSNGKHLNRDAQSAKCQLAAHICARAGLRTLEQQTPFAQQRFTIWHFQLKQRDSASRS